MNQQVLNFVGDKAKVAGNKTLDNVNGILGNVSKAILLFPNEKPDDLNTEEVNQAFTGAFSLQGKVDMRNALASHLIDVKKFEVQFNPSSLKIDAYGGGRHKISSHNKDKVDINFGGLNPYINVSFSAIFDDTNNADAFDSDKYALNTTSILKNVATAVNVAKGNEYTVRPIVEGFLAAIRNESHRMVIFQWGTMRYTGMINNINAKYTMFNQVGNPIRAEVFINILVTGTTQADHLEYWRERYNNILKELTFSKDDADPNKRGSAQNSVVSNALDYAKQLWKG